MTHGLWTTRIQFGVLLLMIGACSGPPEPSSPDVVALWDRGEITGVQLDAFILEQPPGRRIPPEGTERVEWLADQAERLFQRTVVLDDESMAGFPEDPAFERTVKTAVRTAQAGVFLARHDRRDVVSREEAEQFYRDHKAELLRPERRAFRSLYLEVSAGVSRDQVQQRAEDLRKQALGGAGFEALVVAHSDSSNADFGGLVGPVERSDLRGVVGRTVFDLEVGEVSEVIASTGGFLLFQLASLEPASDDQFEVHFPAVAERISNERRNVWREDLVRDQAAAQGVTMPTFDDQDLASVDDGNAVLFEVEGIEIKAGEVFGGANSDGPAARARQLSEDALFAAALRREAPEEAEAVADRIHRNRALEHLLREALFNEVESWPESDFHVFYDANATRFTTAAQVELTVFSWPLGGGDPVEEARQPSAFANALRRGEGRQAWSEEETRPGVRKENVRLTDLRTLAARAPWIASRLTGTLEEGEVVGPFRSGSRLWVMTIDTFVPSRQLSYEEARAQIPASLLASQWREVFVKWSENLAADSGFFVLRDRLVSFGSDWLDETPGDAD